MDKKTNKLISVAYRLYDVTDGGSHLVEETSGDKPFVFLTGFGITLEDFEKAVQDLGEGEEFDFTLTPSQAYGEYMQEHVLDLDRQMFVVDDKFDDEHIFVDAVVPLQNEDGNRFMGRVLAIGDSTVKMDLNHPLAGKTLNFKGHIVDNREATNQEIEQFAKMLSGEGGCGGDCEGGCEGHCDGDHDGHEHGKCCHEEGKGCHGDGHGHGEGCHCHKN
ncbi:peptidylprolyl isomerase [Prevotella sp. KH2C16]|uniref:FKBP-type peptidyl-prolyl cis-trans isomerase n=1 Tax=Prevotella sp. KH2C16 TaxID=1855325 RepID=UPI0008E87197|nr:FKBP-type peptidyl-prolyl cis-trans isomerase [Prevotella sp. KH2C16]SFG60279.1 FKBP-type peptidyl prolyl cis-trans isomerase /Apo-metallochaperone SlyD [Prevotella sp. KH2C16]